MTSPIHTSTPISSTSDFSVAFSLLGAPRSGTNYLSYLIKAHPEIELQVEPLSLHTRHFLLEDLEPQGQAATLLSEAKPRSFVDDLANWLSSGVTVRGFKETTLFGKLPLLAERLPRIRLLYMWRNVEDVVASHLRHDLITRWDLTRRYYFHSDPLIRRAAQRAAKKPSTAVDFVRLLTLARRQLWLEHRHHFNYLEVAYSDLIQHPADILSTIMTFLGLSKHHLQDLAIARRKTRSGTSTYTTFVRPKVSHDTVRCTTHRLLSRHSSISATKLKCLGFLSAMPVTVAMAVDFLNSLPQSAVHEDDYTIYNPYNPDLPIKYVAGRWDYDRHYSDTPATGFSAIGALYCCKYLGGRLPRLSEMLSLAKQVGWPHIRDFPDASRFYNISESYDRPRPISHDACYVPNAQPFTPQSFHGPTLARHLFGNVAEWCLPDDFTGDEASLYIRSTPVFGAGWNKDDSYMQTFQRRQYYMRWGRTGSVSVGFRLARSD